MALPLEWDDAMSSPSADKLAALAVRARQTDSQTEMVAAGVHHRLPALLQLSQSSCASPDCGTSQHECGLRQMQAQCARLLGNLSYLQAHATLTPTPPQNPNASTPTPTPTRTPTLAVTPALTFIRLTRMRWCKREASTH